MMMMMIIMMVVMMMTKFIMMNRNNHDDEDWYNAADDNHIDDGDDHDSKHKMMINTNIFILSYHSCIGILSNGNLIIVEIYCDGNNFDDDDEG